MNLLTPHYILAPIVRVTHPCSITNGKRSAWMTEIFAMPWSGFRDPRTGVMVEAWTRHGFTVGSNQL